MNEKADARTRRLDLAARAAWLYYIKRRTQDEIAAELGVSRPNAQRLVALAISEGLIKFRLDHPLLKSMELGERLCERFGLDTCEVAPSVDGQSDRAGVALLAAQFIETLLGAATPRILALGTGRTLLETVREVTSMDRPDHKVVSAVGNLTRDGRASPYDVAIRLADRIGAQCYPLPLPVLTDTQEECGFLRAQRGYGIVDGLVQAADAEVLGVGSIGPTAPLLIDGFVTPDELAGLEAAGAVGELRSHPIDAAGALIDNAVTRRLTAIPPVWRPRRPTILVAAGRSKLDALAAALAGRFATGLVIDEPTATRLLDHQRAGAP
ncbi:sugar-binding transcriptional regulator [Lichenibacterium ramalinae]|uniref:Sugar-binding transcriptional regulator n=1 Tax=Lichenibacterium ramalinae TaxID=2316527 RepID=A0A4Q2RAB8_9HYPH|nr:sugar-binding domain-containing protein [Lichenibacterium ramalinae]RYB02516.1 sugar-binding transcriptional regulator [Lichenibacterium ramalinae]